MGCRHSSSAAKHPQQRGQKRRKDEVDEETHAEESAVDTKFSAVDSAACQEDRTTAATSTSTCSSIGAEADGLSCVSADGHASNKANGTGASETKQMQWTEETEVEAEANGLGDHEDHHGQLAPKRTRMPRGGAGMISKEFANGIPTAAASDLRRCDPCESNSENRMPPQNPSVTCNGVPHPVEIAPIKGDIRHHHGVPVEQGLVAKLAQQMVDRGVGAPPQCEEREIAKPRSDVEVSSHQQKHRVSSSNWSPRRENQAPCNVRHETVTSDVGPPPLKLARAAVGDSQAFFGSRTAKAGGNASHRSDTAPPSKSRSSNKARHHVVCTSQESRPASSSILEEELWGSFLERSRQRIAEFADVPTKIFEAFRTSCDIALTYACFAQLYRLATCPKNDQTGQAGADHTHAPPWAGRRGAAVYTTHQFPYAAIRVLLGGNWKAKQLWDKLDTRCRRSEFDDSPCSQGRMQDRRAVIVGAGPCGLRAAIELRLLGARVTVLEQRHSFDRLNQLHLWKWCGEELKELGARCLEPPPKDFGANPALLHIGIGDLQHLLLKVALLLGVEILFGASFERVEWERDSEWCVRLTRRVVSVGSSVGSDSDVQSLTPSPDPPPCLTGVSVLIGAQGQGGTVAKAAGIDVVELGSLRAEDAIGLVCNFAPFGGDSGSGAAERALQSFSMARQFFGPLFQTMSEKTGAELENIVYTKGCKSHYFVMTPTRRCLVNTGVVRDESMKPLLGRENVDVSRLDSLVHSIMSFPLKKGQQTFLEAALVDGAGEVDKDDLARARNGEASSIRLPYADKGPQLFDFSRLRRASEGLVFVDQPGGVHSEGVADAGLLVALVGDALLEPFWPEGLGTVRGFFGALDVCSSVAMWSCGATRDQTRQHFGAAFSQLKTLGARTRGSVLRTEEKDFRLAPSSRYRMLSSQPAVPRSSIN
eukprot:TRINITY_DN13357_c0_g1_i1.p1 TRINITY_DN13357_c0_g1~~TRINITY_DN13357_c0_g1_i1.p1  ORF type:complete len:933 (+),score=117.58 TRINITY_DN13357_c0_g1_i1:99-2897(+)